MAQSCVRSRRLLQIERLIISELAKDQPPGSLADREIAAVTQFAFGGRAYDTLLRLTARAGCEYAQAHGEFLQSRAGILSPLGV
jgi:hypothetical protein